MKHHERMLEEFKRQVRGIRARLDELEKDIDRELKGDHDAGHLSGSTARQCCLCERPLISETGEMLHPWVRYKRGYKCRSGCAQVGLLPLPVGTGEGGSS